MSSAVDKNNNRNNKLFVVIAFILWINPLSLFAPLEAVLLLSEFEGH